MIVSIFFPLIGISILHGIERKLKTQGTYGSYFSVAGSVGFVFTVVQLLAKPG